LPFGFAINSTPFFLFKLLVARLMLTAYQPASENRKTPKQSFDSDNRSPWHDRVFDPGLTQ